MEGSSSFVRLEKHRKKGALNTESQNLRSTSLKMFHPFITQVAGTVDKLLFFLVFSVLPFITVLVMKENISMVSKIQYLLNRKKKIT